MVIPRDLIQEIKPFLKRKEFISIIGPRQSGKTTFLEILRSYLSKELGKDAIRIITFEDRRLLAEFNRNPLSFIRSYMPRSTGLRSFHLMIDEFQYAEEDGQKLKLIYDTIEGIKIFVTGSSSLDIKAKVGRFMVGRILNFYLNPFNFAEHLRANNKRLENIYKQHNEIVIEYIFKGKKPEIKKGEELFHKELIEEYEKFCIWGGYPAVVLAKTEDERKKLLSDVYNNYILRDIKTLLELAAENNLFLLSQYLATQIGNITVYQNLCQASALKYRQLKKHLNILEETFICREVRPFFRNRQKELSKAPKIYFMDLGFRNNLVENTNGLDKRSDAGAIVENTSFIRLDQLQRGINKINFWRTKSGAEVDFILHAGDGVIPIEIKYTNFNSERLSKSMMSFIDSFKPERAVILTKNYWGFTKRDKTKVLFSPLYYL